MSVFTHNPRLHTVAYCYLTPAQIERREKQARRQYHRFMLRAGAAWVAYQDAIDDREPREKIVKLGDKAEAMDEMTRSAWIKWNNAQADLDALVG